MKDKNLRVISHGAEVDVANEKAIAILLRWSFQH